MAQGFFASSFVRAINTGFVALMHAPLIGSLLRRGTVVIRYQGRKSGQTFELPVGYRRSGDTITIAVALPDKKNWWRNFTDEGAPLVFLGLDGADRPAHAVATRDATGAVSVTATLS
ncbi:hypothetical protein SBI67_12225 [Mycolicibacterium sp. 120266]|uniref:hypothetical protein n=1 Tax=Mycolicibacterium sp. 120266 TaxID=3090601 RepID=UPI00299E8FD9|nr:hypothetical protein [Mycolicibacterium sp. 120266]MDX1872892.1 hypothetical protein [Mycolicibacterium sp. 120266]